MGHVELIYVSVEGLHWPVVAAKVSQGKIHNQEDLGKYIGITDMGKVYYWLLSSVAHGHPALDYESILEFVTIRFIAKVPRTVSHQLVRHRIASYAQESQRYSEAHVIELLDRLAALVGKKPKDWREYDIMFMELMASVASSKTSLQDLAKILSEYYPVIDNDIHYLFTVLYSLKGYAYARRNGYPPERARVYLLESTPTTILVQMNLRELLHVAALRLSYRAYMEHRELWKQVVNSLSRQHMVPMYHLILYKSPVTYLEAHRAGWIPSYEEEKYAWEAMDLEKASHLYGLVKSRRDIPSTHKQWLRNIIDSKRGGNTDAS